MSTEKKSVQLPPLDPWGAIGQGAGIMHTTDRTPFPPPTKPDRRLEWDDSAVTTAPSKMKKMSTKENLRAKVEELRKKYAPFLEERVPDSIIASLDGAKKQILSEMQFKYIDTPHVDASALSADTDGWETVALPDARGPVGKWYGAYRTSFTISKDIHAHKRIFMRFDAVDYRCEIFINNRFIGSHTGSYVPFEFDITDSVSLDKENILLIKLENDISANGSGYRVGGGIGWPKPYGWTHCPSGAGIYKPIFVYGRSKIAITDLFVRPDINEKKIELWIEVENRYAAQSVEDRHKQQRIFPPGAEADFHIQLYACNFNTGTGTPLVLEQHIAGGKVAGGFSTFKYSIHLDKIDMKLWDCENPFLYSAVVSCSAKGEDKPCSIRRADFGYRTFESRENDTPKGTLYLNNRQIFLRGASTIGHFTWAIVLDHPEQVIEDILIAKAANVNFFRTHAIACDYFDRMGILCQSGLPLGTGISRHTLPALLEMTCSIEKAYRNHPSLIMMEFINEPDADPRQVDDNVHQRMLQNDEMERFFYVARDLMLMHNPDRVVKTVEGVDSCEYIQERDTPFGIQDVHYYTLWYGPFAADLGGLYAGNLYSIKDGWAAACGEYGAEALDSMDTMQNGKLWDITYPQSWIPESEDDKSWSPNQIYLCQQEGFGFNWYDQSETPAQWIERSQKHQEFATRAITEALRLRADVMKSIAVHILIDAFPAGWLKALMSFDRTPKPAYYALADALEPVAVNIRCPQWHCYGGKKVAAELWVFNDTDNELTGCSLEYCLIDPEMQKAVASGSSKATIGASKAEFQGAFEPKVPLVDSRKTFGLYAVLKDKSGNAVHDYTLPLSVHPPLTQKCDYKIGIIAESKCPLVEEYMQANPAAGLITSNADFDACEIVIAATPTDFNKNKAALINYVKAGGSLYLMEQRKNASWKIPELGINIEVVHNSKRRDHPNSWGGHKALDYISRNTGHPAVDGFDERDFSYWYSDKHKRIHYMTRYYLKCHEGSPTAILQSKDSLITCEFAVGKGKIIANELCLEGRLGNHPCARRFLSRIMDYLAGNLE